MRYARPYRARLVLGIVALALLGLAEGVIALMFTPMVDRILTPSSDDPQLPLVKLPGNHVIYLNSFVPSGIHWGWTIFSIALVVIFIGKAIAEYFGVVEIQYVGQAAITDLRNQVYEKLVRQPIAFLQRHPTGRLISTVINDVERARMTLSESLALFFRHIFTLFFLLIVMFVVNWQMALGSAILLPLVLLPVRKLGQRIRRSTESSQSHLGELSQILQETLSGNRVVKAFGMERFEVARFRQRARHLLRENMRWIRLFVITSPLMDILSAVVIALVLLYAREEIKHGVMTMGIFATFVYALFKAYEPVKGMGSVYQQFEQTHGATTQVFGFLALEEEVEEHDGARVLPPFSREVEFDNVSFAYDPAVPILRGISLKARAGEVVAIVGSSGAGKTTLVNLLPRFHDATGGALRIDDVDVRDASLRSLREQMAIVTQETILFNDTVWNNICYGQPDLSEERVIAAARAALAHDFIAAMPEGYQTILGERGQRLSGGPAAAAGHCARSAQGFADPDSRRGYFGAGFRVGDAGAEGTGKSDDRTDRVCDCTPVVDHSPRRQDCGVGRRGYLRSRYAPGVACEERHLRATLRIAVYRRRCGAFTGSPLRNMTRTSTGKAVRSMTGYAQARSEQDGWMLRLSLRSVNHRFLDLRVRMPEGFEAFEPQMRQLVRDYLHRGHVDLTLHIEASRSAGLQINRNIAAAYLHAIEELRQEFNLAPEPHLMALLRLPGVVASPGSPGVLPALFDEKEFGQFAAQVSACLEEALGRLEEMRLEEGRSLAREMSSLLKSVADKTARLESLAEQSRPVYAQRLKTRLEELLGTLPIDPVRIAQEAAMLAERADVAEELARLHSHVDQFDRLIGEAGEVGKKLDFLLQEMQREANTMLSKTPGLGQEGLQMTELGLQIKADIEKLREQVQNVE